MEYQNWNLFVISMPHFITDRFYCLDKHYINKKDSKSKVSFYIGNCKCIQANNSDNTWSYELKFVDSTRHLKITQSDLSSQTISNENIKEIEPFAFYDKISKKTITGWLTSIMKRPLSEYETKFINKIFTDAYTAAGDQGCLNYEKHNTIKELLVQGLSKQDIENKINNKKRIKCGGIFNRRSRNATFILTKEQEVQFKRNDANFGKLPYAVKEHEHATINESNGIVLKSISFLIHLRDFPITERDALNASYKKLITSFKNKNNISEEQYTYLNNHNTLQNTPFTRDFLTNQELSISDLESQQYMSQEHKLNFCHIHPIIGTSMTNCTYGLTFANRLQGDLEMRLFYINHIYGDIDPNRQQLIKLIKKNDSTIKDILDDSTMEKHIKIKHIEAYLQTKYY